jgi:hypothetical protein
MKDVLVKMEIMENFISNEKIQTNFCPTGK